MRRKLSHRCLGSRRVAFNLALALGAVVGPVLAQTTYKCSRNGAVFYGDRPCNGDAAAPQPAAASATAQRTPARVAVGLSPRCRQLAESVQSLQQQVPSSADELLALQRLEIAAESYNEACRYEEQQARERVAETARAERDRRRSEQERLSTTLAQCDEMRRIRDARSAQRATMSAGELADFERFAANHVARCQGLTSR